MRGRISGFFQTLAEQSQAVSTETFGRITDLDDAWNVWVLWRSWEEVCQRALYPLCWRIHTRCSALLCAPPPGSSDLLVTLSFLEAHHIVSGSWAKQQSAACILLSVCFCLFALMHRFQVVRRKCELQLETHVGFLPLDWTQWFNSGSNQALPFWSGHLVP